MRKNIKSLWIESDYPILYPKANAEREMVFTLLRKVSPYIRFEEMKENGDMVTYRVRIDIYEPKEKKE